MEEYWRHMRTHIKDKCVLTCDGFGAHKVLTELVPKMHGPYFGGVLVPGPANMTHVCQPADVGIVRELKEMYKARVRQWRDGIPNAIMTEETAITLLRQVWDEFPEEDILRYWVRSGLLRPQESRTPTLHRWVCWEHVGNCDVDPDAIPLRKGVHPFTFESNVKEVKDASSSDSSSDADSSSSSSKSSDTPPNAEPEVLGEGPLSSQPLPKRGRRAHLTEVTFPMESKLIEWFKKQAST